MTVDTLTLTDFLLARIAEDERDALAADGGRWRWTQEYGDLCNDPTCPYGRLVADSGKGVDSVLMDVHGYDVKRGWEGAAHIARHDPARVLAECEAKRRIVALHSGDSDYPCQSGNWLEEPCPTLRALALPYVDHPDYQDEWRA